ncbi:MAG: phosphodiesterase [Rhodobacteraceae bacterium]|nr:phosphodiesterase [Paracoccaceae bacterium]
MTRILQISDLHLTVPPTKLDGQVDTSKRFRAAIDVALKARTKLALEAVVVTGDISHSGNPECYAHFRKEIERLGLPYFVIPGNHDSREEMRTAFGDARYIPQTGRLNWTTELKKMYVIGIDTLVEGHSGGVFDDETADYLTRALDRISGKPVLISMHHPPFDCGIRFMDNIGLAGKEKLKAVLGNAKPNARIICGHVHNMIVSSVGETIAISAPSPASSFPIDFRVDAAAGYFVQPGGFMLHEWNRHFRSTHIALSSSDELIPFQA